MMICRTNMNAGVWRNLAVRVIVSGVVPMVATTKVLVCLLSAIMSVADAVAKNESTLRDKLIHSFFGLVSDTVFKLRSTFSAFSEAILQVFVRMRKMIADNAKW